MTSIYTQCQSVADDAQAFSRSLWTVLQGAGLRDADLVNQHGLILDQIADERIGTDEENQLWHAYAMKALPQERFSGPDRTILSRRADASWRSYSEALRADEAAQVADHAHDMRGAA